MMFFTPFFNVLPRLSATHLQSTLLEQVLQFPNLAVKWLKITKIGRFGLRSRLKVRVGISSC